MDIKTVLRQAYEALENNGVSARDPLMLRISQLLDTQDLGSDIEIQLKASVAPGGKYEVTDQAGRKVAGVRSVAVFEDSHGTPIFQVNL